MPPVGRVPRVPEQARERGVFALVLWHLFSLGVMRRCVSDRVAFVGGGVWEEQNLENKFKINRENSKIASGWVRLRICPSHGALGGVATQPDARLQTQRA